MGALGLERMDAGVYPSCARQRESETRPRSREVAGDRPRRLRISGSERCTERVHSQLPGRVGCIGLSGNLNFE